MPQFFSKNGVRGTIKAMGRLSKRKVDVLLFVMNSNTLLFSSYFLGLI